MSRVAVVTDSSACLPEELIKEFGIIVLAISWHADDGGEASELAGDETWRLPESIEDEELDTANHPFATEYLAAIETPGYEAAVVVTPAIEFAAMYRNAALAAELTSRPVVVVDSRTAAAGQALVVLAGARSSARDGDLNSVVRTIEEASRRVEIVASLATLDPIRRSGPLPEEVLPASELRGTRSVFHMHSGTVEPLGTVATIDETLETIADAYKTSTSLGVESSTIFHADVPDLALRLEEHIGAVDFISDFSIAMQVHTGRGVVGAAWIPVG